MKRGMAKVRKKDGSLEEFSRDKVYDSLLAAGLTPVDAEDLVKQIQAWVESSDSTISTLEIRERSIDLMENKDVAAAQRYKTYQKPAETTNG